MNNMTLLILSASPTSHGTITLRSADPFDSPIIDPKSANFPGLGWLDLNVETNQGTSPLGTTLMFLSVASSS